MGHTIPLAAVNLTLPSGGAPLRNVRDHEGGVAVDPAVLRKELWGLLDPRAVGALLEKTTTRKQAPGIKNSTSDRERKQRAVDVIGDHLATMRASYPTSFASSGVGSQKSVEEFLGTVRLTKESPKFGRTWTASIANAVVTGALPVLPGPRARAAGVTLKDSGKNFSAQVTYTPTAAGPLVAEVRIGGRPTGVFAGTGGMGSHTTAFVVCRDAINACVAGRTPAAARVALIAFAAPLMNPDPNRVAALDGNSQAALAAAQGEFRNALALAGPLASELQQVQEIARAVVMLLNTQPLSAVHTGGIPDTNREAQSRKAVRLSNVPGAALVDDERWAVLAALWGLFDARSLPILLRPWSTDGSMPGAVRGERPALRAAEVIHHHMQLVSHSYPDAVNRSQFVSNDSLAFLLSEPSFSPVDTVVTEMAQDLLAAGVAINPFNVLARG